MVGLLVTATFIGVSTLLYFDIIPFFTIQGSDWMLNSGLPLNLQRSFVMDILAVPIFLSYPGWFQVGVWSGEYALRQVPRILRAVVNASFPRGGAILLGAEDVKAHEAAALLMKRMPSSYEEAFRVLLVVINSPVLVFALTGKMKHFTELTPDEQVDYLDTLATTPILNGLGYVLKILSAFGYYIREEVGDQIGYDGSFLRRSYVK